MPNLDRNKGEGKQLNHCGCRINRSLGRKKKGWRVPLAVDSDNNCLGAPIPS